MDSLSFFLILCVQRPQILDGTVRNFGPNTSGVNGAPAVINDVIPPIVIEPVSGKPDELVIVKKIEPKKGQVVKVTHKKTGSLVGGSG